MVREVNAVYRALYRRFRPARFGDVVGQELAVRVLRNAVHRDRVAHAYLLAGPRGTGKTSLAKIMAKAVNCAHPVEGEPCGACDVCLGQGLHTVEIDAASNRGIDEVRDLREKARYAPPEGRFKVYIIDEVHMLTAEAFNALLKLLEEPPPQLLFLLATTEPHRLPPTVLSRCQRLNLRPHTARDIEHQVSEIALNAGIECEVTAAALIARKADGSLRDALALLEMCAGYGDGVVSLATVLQSTGSLDERDIRSFVGMLRESDVPQALNWLTTQEERGVDLRQLVLDVLEMARNDMRIAFRDGSRNEAMQSLRLLERLLEIDSELRRGLDPRLALELLAASPRLAAASHSPSGVATSGAMPKSSAVVPPPTEPPRPAPAGADSPAPEAVSPEFHAHFLGVVRDVKARALLAHAEVLDAGDAWELRFRTRALLALAQLDDVEQAIREALIRVGGQRPIHFSVAERGGD